MLGLFCWFAVVSAAVRLALSGVGCLWCLPGPGWCSVLVRPPPPVGACRVCAWSPPWWGVLCRRVWVSVRGVVAGSLLGLFCWFAVVFAIVRPALSGIGGLWCLPGPGWCSVLVRAPPPVGACRVCAWSPPWWGRALSACLGFGSWCCSRLVARLVLLVCRCLRYRTAGIVGYWWSVVFAWPGRTGRPAERIWCATPLSWPGRTGRPLERLRCVTPCFFFAGVVALPLVFPCSPPVFLRLHSSWPWAGVCRRVLLRPPPPPHPALPLAVFCPPLCFVV